MPTSNSFYCTESFWLTPTHYLGEAMKHKIVFVDDEPVTVMAKSLDDNTLLQESRSAFHYFDSMRIAKGYQCEICGEKGSHEQIQMHYQFYMCGRCKNCYERLPGVVIKSLRRFLTGNVL